MDRTSVDRHDTVPVDGSTLRRLRRHCGQTQAALAQAAGVSDGYISLIEQGKQQVVSHATGAQLARALSVTIEDLDPVRGGQQPFEQLFEQAVEQSLPAIRQRLLLELERVFRLKAPAADVKEAALSADYAWTRDDDHRLDAFLLKAGENKPDGSTPAAQTINPDTQLEIDPRVDEVYSLLHRGKAVRGADNALRAAIGLVRAALQTSDQQPGDIFSTFHGDVDASDAPDATSPELGCLWRRTLRSALDRGWNVVHLARLDETEAKALVIMRDMLDLLGATGTYEPRYFRDRKIRSAATDFLLIPSFGALTFLPTRQPQCVDAVYLETGGDRLAALQDHFAVLRDESQSTRLFHEYPPLEFNEVIAQVEQRPGNRILLKDGLSFLTEPVSVYRQRVSKGLARYMEDDPSLTPAWKEAKTRWLLGLQEQRKEKFLERLHANYKFRDFCPKRAIERMVSRGIYSAEWTTRSENKIPRPQVADHLQAVVDLLENEKNYELVLIDDAFYSDQDILVPDIFVELRGPWTFTGEDVLLLETWHRNPEGCSIESDIQIFHPAVVSAVYHHLEAIWRRIAERDKDRSEVKEWLTERIRFLRNASQEEALSL